MALAVALLATSTVLAAASASYGLYWSASSAGGGAADGPSFRLPGVGRTGPGPTPPDLEGGLFLPLVQRSN
jgi:hypothetical protein